MIKDKLRIKKIIGVGSNYRSYIKENILSTPDRPIIFLKPTTSIIYNEEKIILPKYSKRIEIEAELGVVIKKTCKNLSPYDASKYVKGYVCANDITARDLQSPNGQWTESKSFDTFCPISQITTKEIDSSNLIIKSYINNILTQEDSTSNMLFPVNKLISYISKIMTLEEDDLILTGTPAGSKEIRPGDVIKISINQVGELINYAK